MVAITVKVTDPMLPGKHRPDSCRGKAGSLADGTAAAAFGLTFRGFCERILIELPQSRHHVVYLHIMVV